MEDTVRKRANERLDYDVDYRRYGWLAADDQLVSVAITIEPGSGIVLDSYDLDTYRVKIWFSGGTAGKTAHVKIVATTAVGRVKDKCFRVRIGESC